jgi:hypothetical protein
MIIGICNDYKFPGETNKGFYSICYSFLNGIQDFSMSKTSFLNMSTVVQKANNRSKSKSIREKLIQNYVDAKFCRLNSGHPKVENPCLKDNQLA